MNTVRARKRKLVLKQARKLARSGEHGDHLSIQKALKSAEGFVEAKHWFEDQRFREQLDELCEKFRRATGSNG